jgi:hypothetical protein
MNIEEQLTIIQQRIDDVMQLLVEQKARQQPVKEWYTTAEAAEILGRAEFTVREYCRLERINAEKRLSRRGPHKEWKISHAELERIRNQGILPEGRPYRHVR